MPPFTVEIISYPRASHHPKGYWEKPCFSVRLRSGLEWRMPPFRVEMKVVSPSRFATALKGTGKGFPESPSVAALLLMLTPLPYLLRLCRTPRASHHPEGYWEKPCFSVRLRSGLEWRMPPFIVEIPIVVSPSRSATAPSQMWRDDIILPVSGH